MAPPPAPVAASVTLRSPVVVPIFEAMPKDGGDATPAFNAAAEAGCTSPSTRSLHIPAGTYTFRTPPAQINCALSVIGEGKGATTLVRAYNGGRFLVWGRGTDQSGGGLRDMSIAADTGTNGGTAVLIIATVDADDTVNSYNRHSFFIDNVQVGRQAVDNTSWDYGLYLDGSANDNGDPKLAPGIRGIYVDRSSFGGTRVANVYLNKARGVVFKGECYTPLNGSVALVSAENKTSSVLMESRNCTLRSLDHTATDLRVVTTSTLIP